MKYDLFLIFILIFFSFFFVPNGFAEKRNSKSLSCADDSKTQKLIQYIPSPITKENKFFDFFLENKTAWLANIISLLSLFLNFYLIRSNSKALESSTELGIRSAKAAEDSASAGKISAKAANDSVSAIAAITDSLKKSHNSTLLFSLQDLCNKTVQLDEKSTHIEITEAYNFICLIRDLWRYDLADKTVLKPFFKIFKSFIQQILVSEQQVSSNSQASPSRITPDFDQVLSEMKEFSNE